MATQGTEKTMGRLRSRGTKSCFNPWAENVSCTPVPREIVCHCVPQVSLRNVKLRERTNRRILLELRIGPSHSSVYSLDSRDLIMWLIIRFAMCFYGEDALLLDTGEF